MKLNFNILEEVESNLNKTVSYRESVSGHTMVADQQNLIDLICKSRGSDIRKNTDIHYVSDGSVSTHEIVSAMISGVYDAEMLITTFSVTEFPARQLAEWKRIGQISRLSMLLDSRVKANYPQVLQLLSSITDQYKLLPIHAKTCIIKSETPCILISSSNWTENPRFETGMISFNQDLINFHSEWIQQLLQK